MLNYRPPSRRVPPEKLGSLRLIRKQWIAVGLSNRWFASPLTSGIHWIWNFWPQSRRGDVRKLTDSNRRKALFEFQTSCWREKWWDDHDTENTLFYLSNKSDPTRINDEAFSAKWPVAQQTRRGLLGKWNIVDRSTTVQSFNWIAARTSSFRSAGYGG